jgi:hypothetical protein
MNSQQRTELLAAIAQLCQRYPDWRLGQLVANVAGWADEEIWEVEDERLFEAARLHLEQLAPAAPLFRAEAMAEAPAGRQAHFGPQGLA